MGNKANWELSFDTKQHQLGQGRTRDGNQEPPTCFHGYIRELKHSRVRYFHFNLSLHNHIHIAKYLFVIRDE